MFNDITHCRIIRDEPFVVFVFILTSKFSIEKIFYGSGTVPFTGSFPHDDAVINYLYVLFHHQRHQRAEKVKFRAVKHSIYCPELKMLIYHLQLKKIVTNTLFLL